jgi:hypothetical protein
MEMRGDEGDEGGIRSGQLGLLFAAVIASGTKRSRNTLPAARNGLLRRFAPRNDDFPTMIPSVGITL